MLRKCKGAICPNPREALATLSVALSCLAWKGRKRGGVKAAAEREWHNGQRERERVHGGEGGRARSKDGNFTRTGRFF